MIMDVTGTVLTPGQDGADCLGNGLHPGVECCCDECDYLLCCLGQTDCAQCKDSRCPRKNTFTDSQ